MDIEYFVEPIFNIEFFRIKCCDFKNKKKALIEVLKQYPEIPFANFSSNKNKTQLSEPFTKIFRDEFKLIKAKYNSEITIYKTWSISYKKKGTITYPTIMGLLVILVFYI